MNDMKIRFSQWLSDQRVTCGMTLEDVASKTGSHKGYYSGIEHEKVNPPSAKMCLKIGKLFEFHPGYVVYMAYRDKAPQTVQDRIALLEELHQLTRDYFNQELTPGFDPSAIKLRILACQRKLDHMYDLPKNGNGNGRHVLAAAKA